MDPQKLENYFIKARHEAILNRNEFVTREHLFLVFLEEQEIRQAFRDLNIPVSFVREQLRSYISQTLESLGGDVPEDRLAIPTGSLQNFVSAVVLQALASNRPFPRFIDFMIAMAGEADTFAGALFRAMDVKPVMLMRWAADHPEFASTDGLLADDDDDDDEAGDEEYSGDDIDDEGYSDDDDDEPEYDTEGHLDENGENPSAFRRIRGYVTRLVQKARQGKIDPVIGRDAEIDTCCRALLRRTKCNVLIIGEAGVGKTAIVEGLARRIALGNVAEPLMDAEIYSLDVPGMMAGTKLRGEMESRLKSVVKYIEKRPHGILFVDEIHSASGNDRGNGAQDIMNFIKPQLAMGGLRVIGTTTYEDFRRFMANDSALVRRFHKLDVVEPSESVTRDIMRAIEPHYAEFHHVRYTPEAIDAAVTLSGRHMPERRFPDKAIDVIDEAGAANRMLAKKDRTDVIDVSDIERIVTDIAHIPDLHVSGDESASLKTAEARLKDVVFGQDHAIETLVRLVKLSRAGIRAPEKPVASLLFAGPTGVGKTEVARQLALALNLAFVRFDMSEYREEYTISKFIGSAPGYVGYDRGGLLTEAIRSKPNCVLLLDEIEKAHSSIFDLLLQVMDVAKLTDNTGKSADFRNVILIMTSNSGSEDMNRIPIGFGRGIDVTLGNKEIEKTFSPEFRNRLDDIILFNALTPEAMGRIVSRMVGELSARLVEKNVSLELREDAKNWLAEHGYDPQFGARPMARLIQKEISVPLSDEIIFGMLRDGGIATISLAGDGEGLKLECHKRAADA